MVRLRRFSAECLLKKGRWLCLLVLLTSCTFGPITIVPGPSPTGQAISKADAVVSVNETVGKVIPEDFVGLSVEMNSLCELLQLDGQNPAYEQLYKNLGTSVLRIGGNTADLSEWRPYGEFSCNPDKTIVTETLVDEIFAFAQRINWKIVWQLNLVANDPEVAADEASYVTNVGGSTLLGFTIGNEPELYTEESFRPQWWGYPNFRYEWEQYRNGILQRVSAKFIGPEACCEEDFFPNFLKEEASNVIAASHHFYVTTILDTSARDNKSPTISILLSREVLQSEINLLNEWLGLANASGLPLELTEVNSVNNGGIPDVSDTQAAVLWASDFLFQAAEQGVRRVDFHNALNASYDVIDDNGNPTPLYYALLLFHSVSGRSSFLRIDIQTKMNLTAYTLRKANNTTLVVVINKDAAKSAMVEMKLGLFTRATVVNLTAPHINSTNGVTLGQRTVSQDGTWTPNLVVLPEKGSVAYIHVPAGSVTAVTFR